MEMPDRAYYDPVHPDSIRFHVAPFLRLILIAVLIIILLIMVVVFDTFLQLLHLKKQKRLIAEQAAVVPIVEAAASPSSAVVTSYSTYDKANWPFTFEYPNKSTHGVEVGVFFDNQPVEFTGFPKVAQHISIGYKDTDILPLRVYAFYSSFQPELWWSRYGEAAFIEHHRQLHQITQPDQPYTPPTLDTEQTTIGGREALRVRATFTGDQKIPDQYLTLISRSGHIYLFYQPNQSAGNVDMVMSNDVLSSLEWRDSQD